MTQFILHSLVGIQKYFYSASTTVQRTFFKTLELGKVINKNDIAEALNSSINSLYIENQSSKMSYIYTKPLYYGGVEWTMCQFDTVENEFSSILFTHVGDYNNQEIFKRLSSALTQKYGTPKHYNHEESWFDGTTAIILSYNYSRSKSGVMKHYVYLKYSDIDLFTKSSQIIQSEL